MGGWISRFLSGTPAGSDTRILMLGLDGAGKTTILYKLKLGEVITTVPTIGFNVETVEYKSLRFNVWDVGGQKKIRMLWHHYFRGTNGVIFVVDSCDKDRIGEAREELFSIISDEELRDAAVLVFANKQDTPGVMSPSEVAEKMDLFRMRDRKWHVQGTVATTGDGLFEGLEWLSKAVRP